MFGTISLLIAGLGVLCHLSTSVAAEIRVPQDHPTIQAAIDVASNGDLVIIYPGTYMENIEVCRKSIIVTGTNPDDPATVDATVITPSDDRYDCVTLYDAPSSVIAGLTVRLSSGSGSAIYTDSATMIVNNRIEAPNSYSPAISGACRPGQSIILQGNTIIVKANPISLDGSSAVVGNTISSTGGRIQASQVVENTISTTSGSIEASQVVGNTISSTSGSIDVSGRNAAGALIAGNTIANCSITADHDTTIVGNTITGIAKTISVTGDTLVIGNVMTGCRIQAYQSARIVGNTLQSASIKPAILYLWHGASAIDNMMVGQPIEASDSGPIIGNMISGCSSWAAIRYGGSSSIIQGNTIVYNLRFGIYAQTGNGFHIVQNTIVKNSGIAVWTKSLSALVAGNVVVGNGTGVVIDESGSVSVVNNTIVGNYAGGLYLDQGLVFNNIIYANCGSEFPGLIVGWREVIIRTNLITKAEEIKDWGGHVIWGPGNIDVDPLFVDPGHWDDAGTPDDPSDDTFIPGDYHLLPGSPCIDAGTNDVDNPDTPEIETLPATDIAGVPRVIDGNLDGTATVDIGAYEYLPGDVNYDGKVNVLDLLLVRNSLGRDPASSIEARKADVNADGAVNVQDLLVVRGGLGR
ncbi:MAG TPA: right-handed parallel beta-helix repeat-containing protein [Planctomycetota bacterium]|nr:right-handed parallel beta-helix repeat-containing protein [Planctomycetota bacterium]